MPPGLKRPFLLLHWGGTIRFSARGRLWGENAIGVNALVLAVALRGDYEANWARTWPVFFPEIPLCYLILMVLPFTRPPPPTPPLAQYRHGLIFS